MNAKKSDIPANNVEQLRRAKRWSMEKLGETIGTDASTINKIEKGRLRITTDRLVKLADALGVTPNDIVTLTGVAVTSLPLTEQSVAPNGARLPVLGTTAVSILTGAFQLSEEPVDWIDRPKALENARGIYALYVSGENMSPMFRHGSLIVVSEFKPPRIGDAVIVQERRGPTSPVIATIGILEVHSDKILLRMIQAAAAHEVSLEHLVSMHKILDFSEILGAA